MTPLPEKNEISQLRLRPGIHDPGLYHRPGNNFNLDDPKLIHGLFKMYTYVKIIVHLVPDDQLQSKSEKYNVHKGLEST